MNFQKPHELHERRKGRNIGVGLVLGALIAIVFGLTMVKVTSDGFQTPATMTESN